MAKSTLAKMMVAAMLVVTGETMAQYNSSNYAAAQQNGTVRRRIGMAKIKLENFEKEVARARGGEDQRWFYKEEALSSIAALYEEFPNDPEVLALFDRAKAVLMKSNGKLTAVEQNWTVYKRNEENLRKFVWAESEKYWNELIAKSGTNFIAKAFPTPDPKTVGMETVSNKLIVLDVRYPANQFYGGTGEYVYSGAPSMGYWFVALGGRQWLGAYEAVKRYRDEVDSSMLEVHKWKVLGRIVDVTAEYPQAGAKKFGNIQFGYVVRPIALMVPDRVVGFYNPDGLQSGEFVAEAKVAKMKEDWFTVKSVPADVTPKRLMEIFMMAIKEKNFDLYLDCIDPRRREGFNAYDRKDRQAGEQTKAYADIRYHWQLHQERFHKEYVHATFDEAKAAVVHGFDSKDKWNQLFLDDEQRAKLQKAKGELVERMVVESRAIDENGKQLGSPHAHKVIRRNHGRWYVEDYAPRF